MNKFIFCVIAFAAISLSLRAQIEIISTGDVTIGNDLTIEPGGIGNGSVIIDHSGYGSMPAIYANANNCISIGRVDRYIYQGFFRTLWVNGYTVTTSDERYKVNKKKLENSLTKVNKLNGYKYDLGTNDSITDCNQLGFMAQELMTVVPEAVVYDTIADKYGINYIAIIPLLVEAIKEQQLAIETLNNELDMLKRKAKN